MRRYDGPHADATPVLPNAAMDVSDGAEAGDAAETTHARIDDGRSQRVDGQGQDTGIR